MSITAAQVKELRERTGAGMMDAKNALTESGGDMEKAAELLRQKGIATAEKKLGRAAAEGLVHASVSADRRVGALVEVNCETDFVARGDEFTALTRELAQWVVDLAPANEAAFLDAKAPSDSSRSVRDFITDKVGQIKENLSFRRFVRYAPQGPGLVFSYIHTGGKIGVLVELSADTPELAQQADIQQLAKDLALQIASAAPEFVDRSSIPQAVIDEETRVEMGKDDIQSKPEAIRGKIVAGRVDKLMAQRCLMEQPFVKDPSQTVADLIQAVGGGKVAVTQFTRFVLGEGLEKREDNFVQEVLAAQAR